MLETFEQQELRARRRVRPMAIVKAAVIAAAINFALPGGGPWMSYDAGIASMGRVMTLSVTLAALSQVVLALLYGAVVAGLIYSLPLISGIIVGTLVGIPLYAVNYLIFANGLGMQTNEVHAMISHLTFCLFFSTIYRAIAVPPPREVPAGPQPMGVRR